MARSGGWDDASTFAFNLRRLRTASGVSQGDLADRAGMSVTSLARLERGESEPSWLTVRKLASLLNVTCADFDAAEVGEVENLKAGRPPGVKAPEASADAPKRGRGRPKKVPPADAGA